MQLSNTVLTYSEVSDSIENSQCEYGLLARLRVHLWYKAFTKQCCLEHKW